MKVTNAKWIRPPGPPIVWRIFDAKEKVNNNTVTNVRLSIQEIPEDRYEEVLDHMCQYFHADESLCKCLKLQNDANAVSDYRSIWTHLLKQGISIGVFKLKSSGELGDLIGANILSVSSKENEKRIDEIVRNSKSSNVKKIFTLLGQASDKIDVCKIYGVDNYIAGRGLSVKPIFRGSKLGVQILEVWSDIGRKYGIPLAKSRFTGPASQNQSERAGFQTVLTVRYDDVLDENGQLLFPGIEADTMKLKVKQLFST